MSDNGFSSCFDVHAAIARREISAEEATKQALTLADALQPRLNAFIDIFHERALAQARAIDRRLAQGEQVGPLAGVPIAVKDNICLSWGRTTCGSKMLEHYRSPYTATCVQRLLDAGAVVIGKTNLDEFGMGSSCEHSYFGPTRNPWDISRVPGGSSGGSAAAVAAGIVPGALGTDTGGSIRMPAGLCNLVGYKPTYGSVSRYGVVAYASSLDQVGPLTRDVRDAALLASVISGRDPHDSTCLDQDGLDLLNSLDTPVDELVIGVPRQARSDANHPAVSAALENAAKVFAGLGATIVDIDLPHVEHGIAAYYIIAPAEASSNLARFDGVRFGRRAELASTDDLATLYARSRGQGLGPEVQRRIMLGTYVLSSGYYDAYYATAQKVRRKIQQDFECAFGPRRGKTLEKGIRAEERPACHAVLMPSSPHPAFAIGEKLADSGARDLMAMYLEDVYTVGVNLAGLPAVSVPAGQAVENGRQLPVGIQLIGAGGQDALLLRIARMFQSRTTFHHERAPVRS